MKTTALSDLERFEIVQAMFPDQLGEDADIGDEEDVIYENFNIDPEDFDKLVGHLVMFAPLMQSPLTGKSHHVLGQMSISADGQSLNMLAIVKRESNLTDSSNGSDGR